MERSENMEIENIESNLQGKEIKKRVDFARRIVVAVKLQPSNMTRRMLQHSLRQKYHKKNQHEKEGNSPQDCCNKSINRVSKKRIIALTK